MNNRHFLNVANIEMLCITKKTALIFFVVFFLSVAITGLPIITVNSVGLDLSMMIMIFVEFTLALSVFIVMRGRDGFVDRNVSLSAILFSSAFLIMIQLVLHCLTPQQQSQQISIASFFALGIIVPFYEEVFYRGCLFGFLNYAVGNVFISAVATSVVFSLMHTQYTTSIEHAAMFLISMTLVYLRVKTNGLLSSTLLHAATNIMILSLAAHNI